MDDVFDAKLYSINVRGLANKLKRRCVFNWLKNQPFDIFLLQETHSTKKIESIWSSEWGGRIYYSHGQSASGVYAFL